jgi:hypothetical protein
MSNYNHHAEKKLTNNKPCISKRDTGSGTSTFTLLATSNNEVLDRIGKIFPGKDHQHVVHQGLLEFVLNAHDILHTGSTQLRNIHLTWKKVMPKIVYEVKMFD